jgi:hypothetical protein
LIFGQIARAWFSDKTRQNIANSLILGLIKTIIYLCACKICVNWNKRLPKEYITDLFIYSVASVCF